MRRPGVPTFFKVWFAFVAVTAFALFGVMIWAGVSIASDPATIGRTIGKIVEGYNETAP